MGKKEEIMQLWREGFGDSGEYLDMYFNRVYPHAVEFVRESGGKVVSSLLMHQYPILFYGAEPTVGYLAGAVTRRGHRGKGYMSGLVTEAMALAAARGDMMCTLIPAHGWLYYFFERFGFSTVFLADVERYTSMHAFATEHVYHRVTDQYAPEVYNAFSRYEHERSGGVLHSRRDFLNVLDDLAMRSGGTFVAVGREDVPVAAMAWAVEHGDVVQVNEVLGLDADARTGALQALRELFPDRPFRVNAPSEFAGGRKLYPHGMGRIVNVDMCLGLMAAANPELNMVVRVADGMIETNKGVYAVAGGECHRVAHNAGHIDFDVTVEVLANMIFSSPATGDMLGIPSRRSRLSLMLH